MCNVSFVLCNAWQAILNYDFTVELLYKCTIHIYILVQVMLDDINNIDSIYTLRRILHLTAPAHLSMLYVIVAPQQTVSKNINVFYQQQCLKMNTCY